MGEEVFRKKSLDKIQSPESLNDYVRVSNPGVWLLLLSIIALLAGACIWGIFGQVDSKVPVVVQVENGQVLCYVDEQNASSVEKGMRVTCPAFEGTIASVGQRADVGFICMIETKEKPQDGVYSGQVVIRSYRPISFVFN